MSEDEKIARKIYTESQFSAVLDNDVLVRIARNSRNNRFMQPYEERLYIPSKLKKEILHSFHDLMAHQGVACAYGAISQRYYWNKMYNDIRKYVTSCEVCQKTKRNYSGKIAHSK